MSNARNTAVRPGENSDLPPSSEKKLRLLSLITNLLRKRSGNIAASQTGVIYGDDDFAGSPARLRLLDPLELDYFPHDNEIFQDQDENTAETIHSIHAELAELHASVAELMQSSSNGQAKIASSAYVGRGFSKGASTDYGTIEEPHEASPWEHIRR
ncbi:hypothetical protein FJ941_02380 [Mesorhizobium sp. B2-3-13]|uniref:hypothetical protein n=1 Tax=unclassified Mesorhizobium TaxID=325217 RepID=UPI00112B29C8|nr:MULTISPECIES: hypothetical protein [unclassified Mesorhizobium]TPL90915.1 hypothetical protein FJ941_02380 [Mesorhizobium sp. B2-3-13]TPM11268.1 hypothetical protein FJ960_00465 [Mesorhizobium sp. B2-3-11]